MKSMLEFLTCLNWLALPQTIAESLWHADWTRAYQKGNLPGIIGEALSSVAGTNTFPFFVPSNSHWSGADIQALLARHGIKMWGVGWANGEMFFRVSKRQAAWAQYVMLKSGVPLLHRLISEQPNAASTGSNSARQSRSGLDGLLDRLDSLLG